jgi:hypothetical protein
MKNPNSDPLWAALCEHYDRISFLYREFSERRTAIGLLLLADRASSASVQSLRCKQRTVRRLTPHVRSSFPLDDAL